MNILNKFIVNAKTALTGEDGGPQVETIIGISVALIVATALIALAIGMNGWIESAQGEIEQLSTGGDLSGGSYRKGN